MMKKLTFIFSGIFLTALVSCDSGKEQYTERTVIDRDTVAAETEYKVKKTIRERTISVDTVTETETFTRETDMTKQEDELGAQEQGTVDTQEGEANIQDQDITDTQDNEFGTQDESIEEQPAITPGEEELTTEPEQNQDIRSAPGQGTTDTQDENLRTTPDQGNQDNEFGTQDESIEEQSQSTPQEDEVGAEPEGEFAPESEPEQNQDIRSAPGQGTTDTQDENLRTTPDPTNSDQGNQDQGTQDDDLGTTPDPTNPDQGNQDNEFGTQDESIEEQPQSTP